MKMQKLFIFFTAAIFLFSKAGLAHEHRTVAGKYEFVVGFLNEPAFSGQMNALDLRITQDNEPVEGLEQTLEASVRYEDQKESLPLTLKTRYKQPGAYAGYFFPTKPGKYSLEISGSIEGRPIQETFVTGEKFHAIEDPKPLSWPKPD